METEKITGWSTGLDRWHNEGQTSHAMVDRGDYSVPLCGARPFAWGGMFPSPYRTACAACVRITKAKGLDHETGQV